MSSRFPIILALAVASTLPASGTGNALLLQLLETADFDTRLSLCTVLGRREDPSLEDVIGFLRGSLPPRSVTESECLLAALLEGLLDPAWGRQTVALRFEANRSGLDAVMGRLADLQDPLLAAFLVRTLQMLGHAGYAGPILRLADAYRARLVRTGGGLEPGGTQCLLATLSYAAQLGGGEFLDPCLSLQRLSRDAAVIRSARSAAARIAARSGGTPAEAR